jgi:hypothetical protein
MASWWPGVPLSSLVGVLTTLLIIGKFHSGILASLPDFVDILFYQNFTRNQVLILGVLSGCVGMLLLLTWKALQVSARNVDWQDDLPVDSPFR